MVLAIATVLVLANGHFLPYVHAQGSVYATSEYASYQFHTLKNPTGLAYSLVGT